MVHQQPITLWVFRDNCAIVLNRKKKFLSFTAGLFHNASSLAACLSSFTYRCAKMNSVSLPNPQPRPFSIFCSDIDPLEITLLENLNDLRQEVLVSRARREENRETRKSRNISNITWKFLFFVCRPLCKILDLRKVIISVNGDDDDYWP